MWNTRRFQFGLRHPVAILVAIVLCVVFSLSRYRVAQAQVACNTSNLPCLDDATNTVDCIVSSAPCCTPTGPDCFYSFGICCGPSCGPLGGPAGAPYYLAICNEGSPCPTCPGGGGGGGGGGGCIGQDCCPDDDGCLDVIVDPEVTNAANPWLGSNRGLRNTQENGTGSHARQDVGKAPGQQNNR